MHLTVCYYHVSYAFQTESTLYSCLNIKELFAPDRRTIWSVSDSSGTRTLELPQLTAIMWSYLMWYDSKRAIDGQLFCFKKNSKTRLYGTFLLLYIEKPWYTSFAWSFESCSLSVNAQSFLYYIELYVCLYLFHHHQKIFKIEINIMGALETTY